MMNFSEIESSEGMYADIHAEENKSIIDKSEYNSYNTELISGYMGENELLQHPEFSDFIDQFQQRFTFISFDSRSSAELILLGFFVTKIVKIKDVNFENEQEILNMVKDLSIEEKKNICNALISDDQLILLYPLLAQSSHSTTKEVLKMILPENLRTSINTINSESHVSLEPLGVDHMGNILFVNSYQSSSRYPCMIRMTLSSIINLTEEEILTGIRDKVQNQFDAFQLLEDESLNLTYGKSSVLFLTTYPNDTKETGIDERGSIQDIFCDKFGADTDEVDVRKRDKSALLQLIEEDIQDSIDSGNEDYVLFYNSHGFAGGGLGLAKGLETEDIATLLNTYSNRIRINILSNSCRGLRQMYEYQEVFGNNNPEHFKEVRICTSSSLHAAQGSMNECKQSLLKSKKLSNNDVRDNPILFYLSIAYELNAELTFFQAYAFASMMCHEQYLGTEAAEYQPEIMLITPTAKDPNVANPNPVNLMADIEDYENKMKRATSTDIDIDINYLTYKASQGEGDKEKYENGDYLMHIYRITKYE